MSYKYNNRWGEDKFTTTPGTCNVDGSLMDRVEIRARDEKGKESTYAVIRFVNERRVIVGKARWWSRSGGATVWMVRAMVAVTMSWTLR
jgi:hypothetical protein